MKKDIIKVLILTLIAVIIQIICTPIFGGDPISTTEPFGNIAGMIGIIPSVIIMFFISYLHLTLIGFYILRRSLAGNYANGFYFGLIVCVIWLYGMFEAGILKDISQYKELLFGISEAIPIIILGLLISFVLKKERNIKNKIINEIKFVQLRSQLISVLIISLFYLLFRYASYLFIQIESKFIQKPVETFLWTFGNGLLISIFYLFIKKFIKSLSINKIVFVFGITIFGIDWFMYNMFVPVFFNVSIFEIFRSFILRSIIDIISICVGIYQSEICAKKNHLTTAST